MDTPATFPPDFISAQMLDIADKIHRNGFMVVHVGSGACEVPGCTCAAEEQPWAYTIGQVESGRAEHVVVGLAPILCAHLIQFVEAERRAGRPLAHGEVRWMGQVPIMLVPVDAGWLSDDPDRMAMWFMHYGVGRSVLQLPEVEQIVWGDADGRFPGDPACDAKVARFQPLLSLRDA